MPGTVRDFSKGGRVMVSSMPNIQVTTTETLPGFRIVRAIGPVLGVSARSRSPYNEGLKSTKDGHSVPPEQRRELLVRGRIEAMDQMIEHAWQMGANAVVAMRFDHRDVTDAWNEVLAYGTAVWIEPA